MKTLLWRFGSDPAVSVLRGEYLGRILCAVLLTAMPFTPLACFLLERAALSRARRRRESIKPPEFATAEERRAFYLRQLEEEGVRLRLPRGSMVTMGGGWKQFEGQKVEKEALYRLAESVLGIPEENCVEFFGAVEHPILYTTCRRHHFHVPVYSRVLIRDPNTLAPVPNGTPGLVNLLTPMVGSVPVLSIMTDDLGVLHDGAECPCGIQSPWLELKGRVGVRDIVTCAAGASEYLKGGERE